MSVVGGCVVGFDVGVVVGECVVGLHVGVFVVGRDEFVEFAERIPKRMPVLGLDLLCAAVSGVDLMV